ncbi:MAG: lipoyl(octanoyl) transferase LipB [Bacteroidia bacterium]|nr:lipoyl(octanoyl) transferase LipB [Bacteroidia bacterium]
MNFVDWQLIDYKIAWDKQVGIFQEVIGKKMNGESTEKSETIIFCEHPHVYTIGKSGHDQNLLISEETMKQIGAVFYHIDRGGDITYHGPGQLVGYPVIDLEYHKIGVREYIEKMEDGIIATLAEFGLKGGRKEGATGVWLDADHKVRARKICAIGVRVSRFVTMHGFALNVNTDLRYFSYINPCGLTFGVTSIRQELGKEIAMDEVKTILKEKFNQIY